MSSSNAVEALRNVNESWWSKLNPRWMDLLGDFAGSELVILEGDALCQVVLDDPLLAIGKTKDLSFQILHATWALEKLLMEYTTRRCNFEIVFFEDNRHLTMLGTSARDDFILASRSLARQMLRHHMSRLVNITIQSFNNTEDPRWLKYVATQRPFCLMCTDGPSSQHDSEMAARVGLRHRAFIRDILSRGIAIALLDSADYSGTKVLTFIYEMRRQLASEDVNDATIPAQADLSDSDNEETSASSGATRSVTSQEEWMEAALTEYIKLSPKSEEAFDVLFYLFIAHTLLLPSLPLRLRAQDRPTISPDLEHLLRSRFFPALFIILRSTLPADASQNEWRPDIDGRIFLSLVSTVVQSTATESLPKALLDSGLALRTNELIVRAGGTANSERFSLNPYTLAAFIAPHATESRPHSHTQTPLRKLLPLHNPTLEKHLAQLDIATEDDVTSLDTPATTAEEESEVESDWENEVDRPKVVYRDDKHWHNSHNILKSYQEKKFVLYGGQEKDFKATTPQVDSEWAKKKRDKARQRQMHSIHRHAATLSGVTGFQLQKMALPATRRLVKDVIKAEEAGLTSRPVANAKVKSPSKSRQADTSTKVGGKVKGGKGGLSSKDRLMQQIQQEKEKKSSEDSRQWWDQQLKQMEKLPSVNQKLAFFESFSRSKRLTEGWLQIEASMYRLHLELSQWLYDPRRAEIATQTDHTVSILLSIRSLYESHHLPSNAASILRSLLDTLGFKNLSFIPANRAFLPEVPLTFEFVRFAHRTPGKAPLYPFLLVSQDPVRFQLEHFGIYMDRSVDGQPDPRVSFLPDAWQRQVLDRLDARESVLVVAPTSAGKTFISYYAMEQVLRESDDGVLVYVAPTKALVNQVAAEIVARFEKSSKSGSVWAVYTGDRRINEPDRCQILVTVPEMLSIMLLSPALAKVWTPRLRWIILDEIHSVGQLEGGAVWEQLILFAPCPTIGLSATISNPEEFSSWLGSVQNQHGFKHSLIQHKTRYSHLRKFVYSAPAPSAKFCGLSFDSPRNTDGSGPKFLHPMSVLESGVTVLPDDLALESRDCVTLYEALKKAATESIDMQEQLAPLEPATFFSSQATRLLTQKDVLRYEAALKIVVERWLGDGFLRDKLRAVITQEFAVQDLRMSGREDDLIHLLADLHSRNELPAILFNFDREECNIAAQRILKSLEDAQEEWRAKDPVWKQTVARWEAWKIRESAKERVAEKPKKKDPDAHPEDSIKDSTWEETFDPEDPSPQFSFAGTRSGYSKAELEEDIDRLRWSGTKDWLIRALKVGVAVHHGGVGLSYRILIETLFRMGHIRVVIATSTLALGINMPIKSSVFLGDSPFLTALQYRQCAGRAGRRGLDLLGNVLFYGIPIDRVHQLMASRVPPLTGNMSLTTTLSLQLCNLLYSSGEAAPALTAVRSILELPQLSVASDIDREEILHHLRFSLEYLRRSDLLNEMAQPMPMFPLAAHLYNTEPANLALVVLLRKGVLQRITDKFDPNSQDTKLELITLLSHLFARQNLPRSFIVPSNAPSKVIMPPLDERARAVLAEHNAEIMLILRSYARTYAEKYLAKVEEGRLPLSGNLLAGVQYSGGSSMLSDYLRDQSIANRSVHTSLFVANSGMQDSSINTVADLTRTARDGLHVSRNIIQSMEMYIDERALPLNSYILDFFNHGQESIIKYNRIRRDDVWTFLKVFTLAMAALKTGLESYMKTSASENDQSSASLEDSYEDSETRVEDSATVESDENPLPSGKPAGVSEEDWKLYCALVATKKEFDEKYIAIWA